MSDLAMQPEWLSRIGAGERWNATLTPGPRRPTSLAEPHGFPGSVRALSGPSREDRHAAQVLRFLDGVTVNVAKATPRDTPQARMSQWGQ